MKSKVPFLLKLSPKNHVLAGVKTVTLKHAALSLNLRAVVEPHSTARLFTVEPTTVIVGLFVTKVPSTANE